MGPMKRASLIWRLLALIGGAFAVAALAVFLLTASAARHVVHNSSLEVYAQRVDTLVRQLEHQALRLELTGQEDVYRADFQDSVLRDMAAIHQRDPYTEIFPFILDSNGVILLHPRRARGDHDRLQAVLAPLDEPVDNTELEYEDEQGRRQWVVYRAFGPWNWIVCYRVPVDVLMADADSIRRRLLAVWVAATVLVLVGLTLILRREIHPLQELSRAAGAMASEMFQNDGHGFQNGEIGVLSRAFGSLRDAIDHQVSELRESESRYRQIFDAMADGLLLLDQDGMIVAANPQAGSTYGWSTQQLVGQPVSRLLRERDHELAHALRTPPVDRPLSLSGTTRDREGRELETEVGAVRLSFQGRPHSLVILRDVTEQRRLERQLLQSQKLESIGRLAGGIAHDFNNLLTPVLGYSEMLMNDVDLGDDSRADLKAIQRAGERARNLARQLLAFSRQQILEIQRLNLGEALSGFEPILRRTLREDIDLAIIPGDENKCVQADPSQIEQIIMNLAINAMDSMPDGGRIELETFSRTVDSAEAARVPDLEPGRYAGLVVRDTGPGVPEEILDRVFEPFFTTKEAGKGTGLGLATIHGIVKQHGGWVGIRNRPEGGCEVEILLGCIGEGERVETPVEPVERGLPQGRGETVILVEDDAMVRDLVTALLGKNGYKVRAFSLGHDCLEDLDRSPLPADVLLTDVVMPGMNGPELRDQLQAAGFTVPTLFMSGYAGDILIRRGLADVHSDFLQKPISPEQLLRKLQLMLQGVGRAEHGADA